MIGPQIQRKIIVSFFALIYLYRPLFSSNMLRLRNKQFPHLGTVCTDNPSIIVLLSHCFQKFSPIPHVTFVYITNAQSIPRVHILMPPYLNHKSSLLAKSKNYYSYAHWCGEHESHQAAYIWTAQNQNMNILPALTMYSSFTNDKN
jgi:hypothetical protein